MTTYTGKTEPKNGGTVPLRDSKNPVLGVFLHHCGNVATVHQPKGQKSHLRYLHCDTCGCDQASGAEYQQRIRENTFANLEELAAFENQQKTVLENPKTVIEEAPETAPAVAETVIDPLLKAAPLVEQIPEPEKPFSEPSKTVTENQETPVSEPKPNTPTSKPNNSKTIAIFAGFGALFGGLLALVR